MSIYITGDTHSDFRRFSTNSFYEQKNMDINKKDENIVIIAGDFGGVWYKDDSKSIKKEEYWLDWLNEKPFTTVFVSGNHENYDRLYSYPIEKWNGGKVNFIRPSVIHLMRGQVFNLQGHTFFTFGGASSHDIQGGILEIDDPDYKEKKKELDKGWLPYRINHVSWWERELPSKEEMDEGLKNLERVGNKVDFIVTHTPCSSMIKYLGAGLYETDYLTDYLQTIKDSVEYKKWFFGHMHLNENFNFDNSICIYEQIIRIA